MYTFVRSIDSSNLDFKPVLLSNQNNSKYYAIAVDKRCNIKKGLVYACISKDINTVNYWVNKDIKFIINPFDYKQRYFDYSTITVIKQNRITPVIILDEIKELNKIQTGYFLKNAMLFTSFCKKQKVPIIVDLGLNLSNKTNEMQEYYNYSIFDYTISQAKMFNKVVFEGLYED